MFGIKDLIMWRMNNAKSVIIATLVNIHSLVNCDYILIHGSSVITN